MLIGLLCAVVGTTVYLTPWGWDKERSWGLAWLFQARGRVDPPPEVAIVAITRAAADRVGLPYKTDRWPRELHAELVAGLDRAGARSIVFDLMFRESRGEADRALAVSMARAGNVVLLEFLEKRTVGGQAVPDSAHGAVVHSRVQPVPSLAAAAAATGPFTLARVPLQVAQFWTYDANAGDAPSVPLLTLVAYLMSSYAEQPRQIEAMMAAVGGCNPSSAGQGQASRGLAATRLDAIVRQYPRLLPEEGSDRGPALTPRPGTDALVAALCPPSSRFLNFYGPPWSVRTVEYDEALRSLRGDTDAVLPRDFWTGKAVFVGLSSPVQWEQRDEFLTPFSDRTTGHDLSGIEILATAFANLLHQRDLSLLPPWAVLGLLAMTGFLAGLLLRLLRPSWAAIAAIALASSYVLASIEFFSQNQLWLPVVVPVLVQLPLALALAIVWHYVEARRDRARLRRIFGYYLPDGVVDRLAREGLQPRNDRERVFGVCLATDAQQYTALSERLSPEALADFMNAYYALLFEPVRRHGGIVSDVVGDAMMAIWAARDPDVDIRAAACQAALEIADAVSRRELPGEHRPLRTRIGLHCGTIALAHVGAGDHYEYRAVGDIVNTASRLEGLNKQQGTTILVSADMVDGIDEARVRPLGRFRLPGKRADIAVCELLGWRAPR